MSNIDQAILTIGHSDHSWETFLQLLLQHRVDAVADVRSMPYSRFNPQFNREALQTGLKASGLYYVFLGEELGARRSEPDCYVDGKARYELIAKAPRFQEGLSRVREGAAKYRIALLCAEKDPLTCHRTILVCRHLRDAGITISHILEDGRLESREDAEQRLLSIAGKPGPDLFISVIERIEDAYDVQGERIAYTSSAIPANDGSD